MGYCNTKDRTIYSIIKKIQTYKGIFTMDIDTLIYDCTIAKILHTQVIDR